ncbi:immunoglobulin superfamily member 5 isoform 1-T1 [Clarias gariepinus]|uniref:immunoglobulin superfamily member 5 isoform X1 n=1 Tax=Clarias gariepinus TaxID=13013 RepID=UPI00234D3A56|nr:immunoglobulin superfamily member 5 isoform X1 [Clarias gariepinus]
MDTLAFTAILLIITGGVSTQTLQPLNETVLQYSNASFNCSVTAPGWVVMTWTVNSRLALSILESSGPVGSSPRYSATNYTTAGLYKWGFTIIGVTPSDAGTVACQVQGGLLISATLNVQQTGTVAISGSNRTATIGDKVTFQCLAAGWSPAADIAWAMNGKPVDPSLYNTTVTNGNLMNTSSTLTITASNNVSVACLASVSALPSPETNTVYLTVQKARVIDWTVLIATTVAFSLAALLFLIIYGIIFFCGKKRKRRRSRYQEEVRAQTQAHRAYRQPGYAGRAQENLGYIEERPRVDNRDGVYTITNHRHANYPSKNQHPDAYSNRNDNSSVFDSYSVDLPGLQKLRHLTIV